VLHHAEPVFAPISALIVLIGTVGQRLRRVWELVFGVALGLAVGDALIALIGVGPLQVGIVVGLAILVTVFVGIGEVAVGQAASSAVLVGTLTSTGGGFSIDRVVDAIVGGVVGILVLVLLVPFNPLTRVRRAADAALATLNDALSDVAYALDRGDPAAANKAL